MISATVSGTIGKDGELKTVGQHEVLEFSIASRRWEKSAEATDWVRVSFWGQRAAKVAAYIKKGGKVAVRGSLYGRAYAGKDGPACSLEMRADDVELLGGGERSEEPRTQHRTVSARDTFDPNDLPF